MDVMRLSFAELLADIGFLRCGRRSHGPRRTPSGRYSAEAMEIAIAGASKNASNLELLRAVLCAGMVCVSILYTVRKLMCNKYLDVQ